MTFTDRLKAAKEAAQKAHALLESEEGSIREYDFEYQKYQAVFSEKFALELIEKYEALEGKLKEMADSKFAYTYKDRDEFGEARETEVIGAFGPAVLALKELGE